MSDIKELVGKTIKEIEGLHKGSGVVRIFTDCGKEYMFHHIQDCCEEVEIADFDGSAEDVVGALILSAEEITNSDGPEPMHFESWTWTFYKIETNRGGIWMRWLGGSNGYYAESVFFDLVNKAI